MTQKISPALTWKLTLRTPTTASNRSRTCALSMPSFVLHAGIASRATNAVDDDQRVVPHAGIASPVRLRHIRGRTRLQRYLA